MLEFILSIYYVAAVAIIVYYVGKRREIVQNSRFDLLHLMHNLSASNEERNWERIRRKGDIDV